MPHPSDIFDLQNKREPHQMNAPTLSIIVPSYNEECVLEVTIMRLIAILNDLIKSMKVSEKSFILFVDDGSEDKTWTIIKEQNRINNCVKGLKLSRNFGHQNALLAGLMKIKDRADCAISIDADLQQDENAIYKFIDKYLEGNDLVYGVRTDRSTDSIFKRATATFFYNLMGKMGVSILKNHADYRLVSKRVLNALSNYNEVNLFLRGLFPTLGFRSTTVMFDVKERYAGKSKYNLVKMISFAINGITSFSITPIRMIGMLGFVIFIFCIIMSVYAFISFFSGKTVPGWASIILPIYFFGSIQLISISIIGEYIGKIYLETKKRPRFIIEDEV